MLKAATHVATGSDYCITQMAYLCRQMLVCSNHGTSVTACRQERPSHLTRLMYSSAVSQSDCISGGPEAIGRDW